MNRHRRTFLQGAASASLVATAIAAGLLKPGQVLADWNAAGFGATKAADALAAIGASGAAESKNITVKARTSPRTARSCRSKSSPPCPMSSPSPFWARRTPTR